VWPYGGSNLAELERLFMNFDDYADREISGAVSRALAASSENSRQRLQAFRSAINAATKALETALSSPSQIDLTDLVGRVAAAASAQTDAAVQRVRAEAEAEAGRIADEAKAREDGLHAQLAAEQQERETLTASLAESRVHSDELRLELQTDKDRIESARQELTSTRQELATARDELAAAREEHRRLETSYEDAVAERNRESRARAAAEEELQALRASIDGLRAEAAASARNLEAMSAEKADLEETTNAANSQAQAAEAKLSAVMSLFKTSASRVRVLERAQQEHEATVRDLEDKLADARTFFDEKLATIKDLQDALAARDRSDGTAADRQAATARAMESLVSGFHTLSGATTISEVLTKMVKALSREFTRVALFRVRGNRLEGQEQEGFDSKTDIAKVVMPLGMDSLLTRAVNSGTIEQLTGSDLADSSAAPFGGDPTCALALPVLVHGERLGILYADDSGAADPDPAARDLKAAFGDAMLQHGVALLMRLTSELRTLAELRTYAASLLTEMEQMYLSDARAGKTGGDLRKRLKDNLEYARSIYANRIALECPDAAALLDDQLTAMADAQQDTPFGGDLAIVAGRSPDEAVTGQHAAEAS
jgi:chromosome segregation ATPase